MASLLEQMIEAKRRERNRNVLNYSEQPKNVQSALKMAVSYTKANDQPYAGRTSKGHVFATSDQIDIENQIRKNIDRMHKKDLLKVAIFCATSQNEKAQKVLMKKVQRQLKTIDQKDFNYILELVNQYIDKELVARVYHYLSENINGFKAHYMKYCAYYQGF